MKATHVEYAAKFRVTIMGEGTTRLLIAQVHMGEQPAPFKTAAFSSPLFRSKSLRPQTTDHILHKPCNFSPAPSSSVLVSAQCNAGVTCSPSPSQSELVSRRTSSFNYLHHRRLTSDRPTHPTTTVMRSCWSVVDRAYGYFLRYARVRTAVMIP